MNKRKIKRMINRFRYWVMPKEDCKACCLSCPHYKECLVEHRAIRMARMGGGS